MDSSDRQASIPSSVRDVRSVPLGELAGRCGEDRPELPRVAFNSSI